MIANPRALVARALISASCLGAVLGMSACTSSEPGPVVSVTSSAPTVTVRATVEASPEPTPQPTETSTPVEAPFAAVVSIASLDVSGNSVTVGGYVQGLVEEGGACTFVANKINSAETAQASTTGIDNVSTTSCGSAEIPASRLSPGNWAVTLTYIALDGQSTTSDPLALVIP